MCTCQASDGQRPPDELYAVLEGQLQEKDVIMEPHVLQLVTKYMQAGGQPAQVVEHLSDGYEGAVRRSMWTTFGNEVCSVAANVIRREVHGSALLSMAQGRVTQWYIYMPTSRQLLACVRIVSCNCMPTQ